MLSINQPNQTKPKPTNSTPLKTYYARTTDHKQQRQQQPAAARAALHPRGRGRDHPHLLTLQEAAPRGGLADAAAAWRCVCVGVCRCDCG